jgi:methylglutaconyl-CoA hydratase
MQKYTTIELQILEPGVATVILDRPEVHNAFNKRMIAELTEVFQHLASVGKVRLICIKASEKNFCAGADLKWMQMSKAQTYDEIHESSLELFNMFYIISKMTIPLISAVKGSVYGGGLGLLAVSDYVLADEDSKYCFSELRLGLLPATIAPFIMKKIGFSASNALFLSARKFDAAHALNIGLIHQTTNDMEADLHTLIEGFSLTAPAASRQCKEMTKQLNDGVSDTKHYTASLITGARMSDEAKEGIKSLFEKRSPTWVTGSKSKDS